MKIENIYSPLIQSFNKSGSIMESLRSDPSLRTLKRMAENWGEDLANVERWMRSPEYSLHRGVAESFLSHSEKWVSVVEEAFGTKLEGVLRLCPSLMQFDGFARYDSGSHTVWFGIDHPDADEDYLRALLAHELSHVYRDHQPHVWGHLGKPLREIPRREYLENMTSGEHLASEGLATLFSQVLFPEVPIHTHHYYLPHEMEWTLQNNDLIDRAIIKCLRESGDVWSFYEEDIISPGSPSRTHYYWAAKKIADWLPTRFPGSDLKNATIAAHGLHSSEFTCFK